MDHLLPLWAANAIEEGDIADFAGPCRLQYLFRTSVKGAVAASSDSSTGYIWSEDPIEMHNFLLLWGSPLYFPDCRNSMDFTGLDWLRFPGPLGNYLPDSLD